MTHDGRPLARAASPTAASAGSASSEPAPGKRSAAKERPARIDHVDAPTLPQPGGDERTRIRAGTADDQVQRRQDRVEHRVPDERRPAVGHGQRGALAQRVGLADRQPRRSPSRPVRR